MISTQSIQSKSGFGILANENPIKAMFSLNPLVSTIWLYSIVKWFYVFFKSSLSKPGSWFNSWASSSGIKKFHDLIIAYFYNVNENETNNDLASYFVT